jgi:D-cysteine desulfhydrase family pyridoxal phosphate-dependent enzyme
MDRARAVDRFEQIPRLALGHFPTPLEKLPRLRAALGRGPSLYIKRDDYTGPGFGGNKVRKLEYVLADALAAGADCLITCGGEKSNHCRATAMLAAKLGLECHLVLNPAAVVTGKPASLAIDEWVGARIVRVASGAERAPRMEQVAERLRSEGRQPYGIPLGASSPLGAMGFVAAASELAAQMAARELTFDAIFVSSSSGGTQSGLSAGVQLFLPGTRVIGISPDDPTASIQTTVGGILSGVGARLGIEFQTECEILDQYIGPGYGVESDAGREAFQLLARTEGILLDPVYTAKAMAGMLDWIRSGRSADARRVLFWHTGGQMALFHA